MRAITKRVDQDEQSYRDITLYCHLKKDKNTLLLLSTYMAKLQTKLRETPSYNEEV